MATQLHADSRRFSNRARVRRAITETILNLLLCILIGIILIPILYMILISFKGRSEILNTAAPLIPTTWHFENYSQMWKQIRFGPLFLNSAIVVGTTTVVATFFAAMAGYALARFRFPGSGAYSLAVVGTQIIPGSLFLISLYLTFLWIKNTLHIPLIGNNLGGIVLYVGFYTPISIWILRGFFASIPPDLEEQAMVDGATRFRAFWSISLPLALPGIVSTAIYVFMTAWDEMLFGYTIGIETIPVGVRKFVQGAAGTQLRFDYMAAASVVVTIPITIMFLALQRHFIRGLTAGAVK